MPISPAREAALFILQRVEAGRGFAVELLQSPRVSGLSDADRRLTTALVMGVLRWRGDLDFQIENLSSRPLSYFDSEVLAILRLGIYQLRHLENVPAHAAVHESVEMVKIARKRSAAGLVNAVLRKCKRLDLQRAADGEYLESSRRSVPGWMRERWRQNFGGAAADSIVLASQSVPRTCLRLTGAAASREDVQRELRDDGVETEPGTVARRALWVTSGNVLSSAAWRDGRVVIQDEVSQRVAELVSPLPGQTVLDLCAAPGIKSGQIADDLRAGTYVACDRSPRRLRTMESILRAQWPAGVRRYAVLADAAEPLPFALRFDRVLVDAPCSGTGTLSRNPEIKWRLRSEDILRLAAAQCRMLQNGLTALAPGGRLVYATCSLEPEENEQVVAKAVASYAGYRQLRRSELRLPAPPIVPADMPDELFDDAGSFRTRPGMEQLDGFFAAVLVRV
ncbi:MAG: 16S rRNA (cytosine(967)-C(5))-methyltransferase RsmB [Terriglobia bacterium]